jgi:hypothetical protein
MLMMHVQAYSLMLLLPGAAVAAVAFSAAAPAPARDLV